MAVFVCFFLSGAAALILQVLWTRMLGLVFGATALAISTTLTVFMAGLAIGSHFGGKWAPRLRRPLLAFAVLETAVGIYGLLVPSLLDGVVQLQTWLGADFIGFPLGYALFRFVLVSLVLLIPTTAMGATLPILAEGVVARGGRMAEKTGQLFAANTFGAVVGAFTAGFFLIPALGLEVTVYAAAAIDLAVAATVVLLFRIGGTAGLLRTPARKESTHERLVRLAELAPVEITGRQARLALLGFALSGAAAMALEVLWSRAIGVTIGASTYSFTLILTTFLVGLSVGAALMSRRVESIRDPVRWLARVEIGVGATAIIATTLIDRMPMWLLSVAHGSGVTMEKIYLTNFLIAVVVTLPATLLLGTVMPLVVRILQPNSADPDQNAGPIVGRAYALNTIGAIVGSFLGGFVILPVIGVEWGLHVAALSSIGVGVILALTLPNRRDLLLAAGISAALVIALPGWNVGSWTSGMFRMYLAKNFYQDGWSPNGKVIYHRDGVATTVTVEQHLTSKNVTLKVNGKVDASDVGDMPTQVLSGLLPIFLHPNPKEVLVIGYGSGVTPGAVLQAPIEKLDVAEIEAAVYEAANTHFAHVNHEPAKDPRATLFVDDGRNHLRAQPEGHYDVIISEPSNPWMTGAASLFTTDFFEIAKKRLAKDGVFLQWLQLYELAPENIHSLIRTFHSVFPELLIFTPDPTSNDTLLVGANHPLVLDRARLAELFSDPKLKEELKRAEVTTPEDMFGLFLLGTEEVTSFVGSAKLNTDDNALIEFRAPRDLLTYADKDPRLPFRDQIVGRRFEMTAKYFKGFPRDAENLKLIGERLVAKGRIDDAHRFLDEAKKAGADVSAPKRLLELVQEEDDEPALIASEATEDDEDYLKVAARLIDGRDESALRLFETYRDLHERTHAHRLLYAFLCYRNDRRSDAKYLFQEITKDDAFLERNPNALYYAGRTYYYEGEWETGIRHLERYEALTATTSSAGDALAE